MSKEESVGFSPEDLEYLQSCMKHSDEMMASVERIMEIIEELKQHPEAVQKALEEVLKNSG